MNNVANLYQNASRIFMEYVDNSLDDAEFLYQTNRQNYPYPIKIDIYIDPAAKKVTFIDNCRGMNRNILLRILTEVGSSNKKAQPWTNGQFGFGIHAFRACAEKMSVISIAANMKNPLKITVDRNEREAPDEKEISRSELSYDSGTKVTLFKFDKEWWIDVNSKTLKEEIQNHFEGILTRSDLSIRIHDAGKLVKCRPMDYKSLSGFAIEREISELELEDKLKSKIKYAAPLKIYLKVTDQIIPNKRPIFLNKGRRIDEVQSIKSFMNKSKYRIALWGHNNLTGYIEVNGNIEPTIERNEFKRNNDRKLIYSQILDLEEDIYELIQKKHKSTEEASLSKLEDILSSALSKLAKLDALRYRTISSKGSDVQLRNKGGGEYREEGVGGPLEGKGGSGGTGGRDEGDGAGIVPGDGEYPEQGNGSGPRPEESDEETGFTGRKRKKSGFNISISDQDPPEIKGTEKKLRSQYLDGTIYIYKNHPSFQERIKRTLQGEPKLNQRLISYLSSEISVHYKNVFYEKKKMQPDIRKLLNSREELFKSQVEFVYAFEEILQPLENKNLFTLENFDN
ncbi:MAG: ATP-binding protein [Balneolaceae bacterium]